MVLMVGGGVYGGETDRDCGLVKFIDEPSLIALTTARDTRALRSIWNHLPYRDLVHRVVYSTRLATLDTTKSNEIAVLETIPTCPLELQYVYAINDTKVWTSHPAIPEVYDLYFKTLGRLTAKNPGYIERLFLLSSFADGEAKDDIDDAIAILKELNPAAYLSTLKKIAPVVQMSVCGDCPELQE
jgi:hypothetical protein